MVTGNSGRLGGVLCPSLMSTRGYYRFAWDLNGEYRHYWSVEPLSNGG